MVKLNRTTEYALISIRHMAMKLEKNDPSMTSAREISDRYQLPFEITAKTLQRMRDTGIIQSEQGARGGYTLKKKPEDLSLAEFLELMEGPQSVVGCTNPIATANCACEYQIHCDMQDMMKGLNDRVRSFLSGIRLSEFAHSPIGLTIAKNEAQEAKAV
jgi:Rrf2 family protein